MMNFKNGVKEFKRMSARQGMFFSTWLFAHLPYPLVKGIMHVMVTIAFQLTIRLKRIARESLDIAFGDSRTDREKKEIIKKCFKNLGQGMIEMVYYTLHPEMIRNHITIEGQENLDEALKRGRGVVALTAHFGNFPLMMLKIVQMGYKARVVMRRTRDPKIDELLLSHRTRLGLGTIYTHPRKACVQASLRALRDNEILFLLMDQHFGSEGGIFVDFFGQKAATAPGAVVFAERAQSPVVPIFIRRLEGDNHRITILPPVDLEKREDYEEMLEVNVAKLTRMIEEQIRIYPHEWGWMHRRWKNQPGGAVPAKE